jgi:dUTP pyrophosphatase
MRHGLTVLNAPGTIDADYRGEIAVILINHSLVDSVWVNRGDRIAQLVIAPVCSIEFDLVESISVTARGEGGFGSTG